MRKLICLTLFVSCGLSALAQADIDQVTIEDVADTLINGPAHRGIRPYTMPQFTVGVSNEQVINAHTNARVGIIVIPRTMVHFLQNDRGELAFVIAHEIGHIQSQTCPEGAIRKTWTGREYQRRCEAEADMIGLQYLMAAGYSPYDAAAFFGRMMMYNPLQNSIAGILVGRFGSDHPVTPDRISNLSAAIRVDLCATA